MSNQLKNISDQLSPELKKELQENLSVFQFEFSLEYKLKWFLPFREHATNYSVLDWLKTTNENNFKYYLLQLVQNTHIIISFKSL